MKAYIWHLLLEKWQLSHNFLQSNKQVAYGKIITAYGALLMRVQKDCPLHSNQSNWQKEMAKPPK